MTADTVSMEAEELLSKAPRAQVPKCYCAYRKGAVKMHGADGNHTALKSLLHALMDMNDISSQGNNQVTGCLVIFIQFVKVVYIHI